MRPLLLVLALALAACTDPTPDPGTDPGDDDDATAEDLPAGEPCSADDTLERPDGWAVESHCKGGGADYARLFDDTVVHRFDIEIDAADYAATMDDLADILGGGGGPGGPADVAEEPMWVPVTVRYDGDVWTSVGMRYKGNSSLRSAYSSGGRKLPFRLGFDHFEDEVPAIDDQRMWGFKKLTFSSGFKDDSLVREKVGADLFREAGVPAARGAFVAVFVDFGEGPTYFGLYTMVEDPSNKMLDTQFADDSGNLYKPDGDGARLTSFDQESMVKKTNEEEADWSDVQALIEALNGDRTDAAAWRAGLEAVFDAEAYLTVLAVNQTLVNWDTYGWMTHNYYLYADPSDDGRLVWFPWDLNESMLVTNGGPGGGGTTEVFAESRSAQWPMIRFLLDDAEYEARYRQELGALLDGAFDEDAVVDRIERYHDLIAPWVTGEQGESSPYTNLSNANSFNSSVAGLRDHVQDRRAAVQAALAN